MSSTMDVLAREVIGYHFCQMDNEETCGIPQFVHSLAAQMSQSPMLSSYRKLIANDGRLQVSFVQLCHLGGRIFCFKAISTK